MGLRRSTDLISAGKSWVWREVHIWICIDLLGKKQKNHGSEMKCIFDISRKIMGWARSTDLIKKKLLGRRQKNHGSATKYRFDISKKIMGLVRSTHLNLYWFIREKAEKSWVWDEVHIWYQENNHGFCVKYIFEFVLIYIEWGRKIMGLARSTDLNSYTCKRKGRKIMGLSRSTHLVSHNSITGISRKIMGLARSTDLNLY